MIRKHYGHTTAFAGQRAAVLEPTPTQVGWKVPESSEPNEFTVMAAEDDQPLLYFYVGTKLYACRRRPVGFL